MRTRAVPTGLAHLVYFARHFRAGLSHPAATRLEFWWCLLDRLRSMVIITWSLEATPFEAHERSFKSTVGNFSPSRDEEQMVPLRRAEKMSLDARFG